MKTNKFWIIIVVFLFGITTNQAQTCKISGNVKQTFSYCGGARPDDSLLERLAKPVAFVGKKFYIRKGKTNILKSKVILGFETDSLGNFSFYIKPGIYSILLEEQLKRVNSKNYSSHNQSVDEKCLKKWWSKPYYLLVVTKPKNQKLDFLFQHRCFINNEIPCIEYIGEMPN
jgi:hypothetical protein